MTSLIRMSANAGESMKPMKSSRQIPKIFFIAYRSSGGSKNLLLSAQFIMHFFREQAGETKGCFYWK